MNSRHLGRASFAGWGGCGVAIHFDARWAVNESLACGEFLAKFVYPLPCTSSAYNPK